MPSEKQPFYDPPENGAAMRRARREKGLNEEIALLRVKLKAFVESGQPDQGLVLSAINTLGRALMAQAHIGGNDPAVIAKRMAAVIRQMAVMLEEDHRA